MTRLLFKYKLQNNCILNNKQENVGICKAPKDFLSNKIVLSSFK